MPLFEKLSIHIDDAEDYDTVSLRDNETIIAGEHPSILPIFTEIILTVGAIIGIIIGTLYYPELIFDSYVSDIPNILFVLLLIFIILGHALKLYLDRRYDMYLVTDQRILKRIGFPFKEFTTKSIPYETLQDLRSEETTFQWILRIITPWGYGNITLKTAGTGEEEAVFKNCPNHLQMKETIENARGKYTQRHSQQQPRPTTQD